VVEFALLLPVLLLLLLALVQVGVLTRDRLLLEEATRAGAREAAVTPDEGAIRDSASSAAPGLEAAALRVSIARVGARGDPVTVSVAYDVPIAGILAGWLFPPIVTLEASATARQEYG
jgi:Flp pilus assembly protein TadG